MHKNLSLLPNYWFWKGAIPGKVVDCLLEEVSDDQLFKGTTHQTVEFGYEKNPDVRKSDIMLFESRHWFAGALSNIALESNINAGWQLAVTQPDALQVAYYGPEQYYDWHPDSILFTSEPMIRKLTVICMLTNRSEYEGGILELEETDPIDFDKGDVIVFPSILKHRVTPVKSGLRKTATMWIIGNRRW